MKACPTLHAIYVDQWDFGGKCTLFFDAHMHYATDLHQRYLFEVVFSHTTYKAFCSFFILIFWKKNIDNLITYVSEPLQEPPPPPKKKPKCFFVVINVVCLLYYSHLWLCFQFEIIF